MVAIAGGETQIGEARPSRPWQEQARTVTLTPYCVDRYEYPNRAGELPTANVTWDAADAACQAAGKRLCTSDEWERACRGADRSPFSYGPRRDASICNTPIDGPGPGSNPPPIAPSGAFPGCVTPEGVFDMNGSLSEWVSTSWDGDPEPFNRHARVDPATWRVLRGGTMWNRTFYGQDCTSRHGHERSTFKNMDDGFRCCRDQG